MYLRWDVHLLNIYVNYLVYWLAYAISYQEILGLNPQSGQKV